MASTIQYGGGDEARARKTFAAGELNWHTEMNRNWTETVDQLWDLEATVAGKASSVHTHLAANMTDFNTAADLQIGNAIVDAGVSLTQLWSSQKITNELALKAV